jgi:hypothetical protein
MRPVSREAAEQRDKDETNLDLALLRAMIAEPDATQMEWGQAIRRAKSSVNAKLQKLKKLKFVDEGLGKWRVTPKGMKEAGDKPS